MARRKSDSPQKAALREIQPEESRCGGDTYEICIIQGLEKAHGRIWQLISNIQKLCGV